MSTRVDFLVVLARQQLRFWDRKCRGVSRVYMPECLSKYTIPLSLSSWCFFSTIKVAWQKINLVNFIHDLVSLNQGNNHAMDCGRLMEMITVANFLFKINPRNESGVDVCNCFVVFTKYRNSNRTRKKVVRFHWYMRNTTTIKVLPNDDMVSSLAAFYYNFSYCCHFCFTFLSLCSRVSTLQNTVGDAVNNFGLKAIVLIDVYLSH